MTKIYTPGATGQGEEAGASSHLAGPERAWGGRPVCSVDLGGLTLLPVKDNIKDNKLLFKIIAGNALI